MKNKNYRKDQFGAIHQIDRKPFVYNKQYIDVGYGQLKTLTNEMSYLRLGYIIGAIGRVPESILDVGYGTGDFLRVCTNIVKKCSGHDLFEDLLPPTCEFVTNILDQRHDVITFFDSLEHYPEIDFIKELKCNYLAISLPWCHNFDDEWFENWKHRKPDEHLHHFNKESLAAFMLDHDFEMITYSNVEDVIRKSVYEYPNILTAVFRKI